MDENLQECITKNDNDLYEIRHNEIQLQLKQFISFSRIFDDNIKIIVKNEDGNICYKVTICRRKNYM